MIEVIRIENEQNLGAATAIREKVFVIGQGVPREAEQDEHEATSVHYLATYGGVPCGAARWRKTDQGVKLERFAVLDAYRNKSVGAHLLHTVLQDVHAAHPDAKIYLHAQAGAMSFYLRNGFEIDGGMFIEQDINHYKMYFKG